MGQKSLKVLSEANEFNPLKYKLNNKVKFTKNKIKFLYVVITVDTKDKKKKVSRKDLLV